MKATKVIALVSLMVVAAWLVWRKGSQTLGDAAMAARAVEVVTKALQEDAEIKFKFGRFLNISGSGYSRPGGPVLIERLEADRAAQFERGTLQVHIVIAVSSKGGAAGEELATSQWRLNQNYTGKYFLEVWVEPAVPQPRQPHAASLSKDGGRIFLGYKGKVEMWDRSTKKLLSSSEAGHGFVKAIEPSADGTRLAVACANDSARVLDIETGAFIGSAFWYCNGGHPLALSQDGSVLVTPYFKMNFSGMSGAEPTQIAVVTHLPDDTRTPLVDSTLKGSSDAMGLWLSLDGRHVVAKEENGSKVRVWDTTAGEVVTFIDLGGSRHDLAFTPRSSRLVSASRSPALNLSIWEIPSGEKKATIEPPPKDTSYDTMESFEGIIAINTEESLLAFGLSSRVFVWDLTTFKFLGTISGKAWTLEGSIANPTGLTWERASGSTGRVRGVYAGDTKKTVKRLRALGIDAANRIVALSFTDDVCWIWSAIPPAPQPANIDPERKDGVH